ncbi:non-specific lipid transfer protein GPI-anchored 16 [Actinidia eriantha]|uniref:non-specific lipid transfer protein GPI-anchored 16 n=1 Tax=Actinidia eriantha TaxID=165200 RepID=UPI002587E07D|nr:non-specific lipid transfer protein GPI-anchored 16 [Actinidia eriantha]
MEGFKISPSLIAISVMILVISVISADGQISTACTNSMINSFTPCLNFITGSSGNGASPTAGCCDSLKSLMGGSMDCACLIVTGNIPFSLPINRTLAISLPRACKSSVPIQCKASGVPLPAPGPVLFAPPIAPTASSPFSPRASKAAASPPSPSPEAISLITPAAPPVDAAAPTTNPGIRPVVTPPSASNPSYIPSPYILLVFMAILFF